MKKKFKILLVSIFWEKQNVAKKILKSKKELKPNIYSDNYFEYDMIMYEKCENDYYQFCIQTENTPMLKADNLFSVDTKLFNIQDDLWIIKGDWDYNHKGIGYHKCPSINTAGRLEIELITDNKDIQETIKINISPNIKNFNFEMLMSDFEGELWNLLTLNQAKVTTKRNEKTYCNKTYILASTQLVIDFLTTFDKIASSPKEELKYITETKPVEKVKPIPDTYKKIAQYGLSKNLPSKSFAKNIDIYENQFVCYMLYKIYRITTNDAKFTTKQIERIKKNIKTNKEKIKTLQNPPTLNKEELIQDIKKYQEEYKNMLEDWNKTNDFYWLSNSRYNETDFSLKINYGTKRHEYYYGFINNQFAYFKIPLESKTFFDSNENKIFDVRGHLYRNSSSHETKSGKLIPFYFINSISSISPNQINVFKNIFKQKYKNYQILKENNFNQFSILNKTQILKYEEERNNQIETIKKQNIMLQIQIEHLRNFTKEYREISPEIKSKLNSKFCKMIDYQFLSSFIPSMTFIQNPLYRKAYNLYKKILDSEGIDVQVFDLYDKISEYGIREMPIVYELWVLISTLRNLEKNFHIKHNPQNFKKLLEIITPNSKKIDTHVKIEFNKSIDNRKIILHYQKKLENNKRPDILLEIIANENTDRQNSINVILDAKYKNFNYKLSANYEISRMVEKYKIDNNFYVFIVHPCDDIGYTKLTNFGGEKNYIDNKIVLPFHRYGYIKAKPSDTDNIKKIIGMSVEYLIEKEHSAYQATQKTYDPIPENKIICLSCGSKNVRLQRNSRGNNRFFYFGICLNKNCNHKMYFDYCWNCRTKLYKHGSYWDYHKTSIWNTFDIHCPKCEMTLIDKPDSRN